MQNIHGHFYENVHGHIFEVHGEKKTLDHMILQIAISVIHDQKSRDLMILISTNPVITWFWSEENRDPEF